MLRDSKKWWNKVAVSVAAMAMVFSMSSCNGDFVFSDESKQQGMKAICSAAGVLIGQLETGGAIAKLAAGVIADNSKDEKIVEIATKVKNGNTDKELLQELTNYLNNECGE